MVRAGVGMTLSRVCSASELFTCWSTTGNGDPFSTEPTTQAISRTETMLTTEPPTESSTVAERQVTVDRMAAPRSEEHTSELQSHVNLVCRLLLEKKKKKSKQKTSK